MKSTIVACLALAASFSLTSTAHAYQKYGAPRSKARTLKMTGGSGTEETLEKTLKWIVEQQQEDGSWSASANADGATTDVGVTALCALSLLSSGEHEKYTEAVGAAVAWMLERQDPETGRVAGEHAEFVYEHALATEALGDAMYLYKNEAWEPGHDRALAFLWKQQLDDGSFPLGDGDEGDPASTGAAVATLGLWTEVVDDHAANIKRAVDWLVGRVDPKSGAAQPGRGELLAPSSERSITAMTIFAQFVGGAETADLEPSAKWLTSQLPTADAKSPTGEPQYVYLGSYAAFQVGGRDYWKPWNAALKPILLERESWGRRSKESPDDVLLTAVYEALTLEVYFRFPFLQLRR